MDTIEAFLNERKEKWLKEKLKKAKNEGDEQELQEEANAKFGLLNWLTDASKRVTQLSMVSHIGKFTHPSAKVSAVIAKNQQSSDGYVRSGNIQYELDVLGNAAAMDVYKFLSLEMDDKKTVLLHLEQNTETIKKRLNFSSDDYQTISAGLLKIKNAADAVNGRTDASVKQVYFPISHDSTQYHLLSILTPSGIVAELKKRIDMLRFSDETKLAREARRNGLYLENGYDDLPNLTQISYGGSKPQNISVLNNKNAGLAYLLPCIPMQFEKRDVHFPKTDFFKETLRYSTVKASFDKLFSLIRLKKTNVDIRENVKTTVQSIVDQIFVTVYLVRKQGINWTEKENYQHLPRIQRILLDDKYKEKRQDEDWFEKISVVIARWISQVVTKKFGKDKTVIGTAEFQTILDWVSEIIKKDIRAFQ